MNLGSFRTLHGRPAVRFTLHHPRPPRRVWLSLTETARLDRWFPAQVTLEPREGGTVFFGNEGFDPMLGTVLAYEEAERLGFTFGADEVWFDLVPDGDSTLLTMTIYLADRDLAALNAAGWTTCLGRLELCLQGEQPRDLCTWEDVYDQYVLAGMPATGSVDGLTGLA
ncbi:SRPBCC domain-containing protein [Raineyella sp.]|uniref:Activator of Hsp90 ATPase homologue 1/2-like C-terminal domain-containing protein n=1 Tax=bioreactor metagenome TaxID=1076179 RepID=A0A645D5K7_9ZZZZ|nr:SRPBCC domain-containing protein [Raineyella sp.]MEA5154208.1 SRPBCC domain-containing protein [Raineyella sp.]